MKNGLMTNGAGDKYWYLNDLLHRENGPAVENIDGTKYWLFNGKYHREDGPAIEWADGSKEWFINGKRHRKDGPAIESTGGLTGLDYKDWYYHGKWINCSSQEDFERLIKLKSFW